MLQNADDIEPMPEREHRGHSDFWDQRDILKHIREFSQARIVGPWGVLGSLLVRATCAVPPHIQLPPTTGGRMSLNTFCAMVGASGVGKGGCDAVAREAVRFHYGSNNWPCDLLELPTGSGEGIARSLKQADAGPDDDTPDTVLFNIAEVETVAALFNRQGSTLESELRKVYSGEQLGFTNSQKNTRTRVAAHSYRAGMIIGVQPLRANALLKGADGGTPQRILWVPVDDPDAPEEDQAEPEPLHVKIPAINGPHLKIPASVRDEMRGRRRQVMRREQIDPLDTHRLLTRLKVAAALMLLDARTSVTLDDWELAGQVMAVSDDTRDGVVNATAESDRQANQARAEATADREVIIRERLADNDERRVLRAVRSKLARVDKATEYELNQACHSSLREDFKRVFDVLKETGVIVRCEDGGDGDVLRYQLAR